ncbi:MAG: Rpn family recombination-promoting nuclease/putative transposase [Alphaproteobacteria bacterium]|nr:Rpn family recombination-promoting nuclease/putative transposase [Alphaproteobacteria bacterium]
MPSDHDRLFKAVLSQPRYAAQHFRDHLQPEVLRHLQLDTLELVDRSFIGEELSARHVDLLFKVTLASGEEALVYLLLEHQSTPDPMMALRVLGYLLRIWEAWVELNPGARRLPLILPLVLYHGEQRWNAPLDIADLIDIPEEARGDLALLLPRLAFDLADLDAIPDEQLVQGAVVGLVKLLLKHYRDDNLGELLDIWEPLARRAYEEGGLSLLVRLASYIMRVAPRLRHDALRDYFVRVAGPQVEETIVTIADQLRAEGRQVGRQQGRQELFLELLEERFGPLPEARLRLVRAADGDLLRLWSRRLLSADSLDAVFGEAH